MGSRLEDGTKMRASLGIVALILATASASDDVVTTFTKLQPEVTCDGYYGGDGCNCAIGHNKCGECFTGYDLVNHRCVRIKAAKAPSIMCYDMRDAGEANGRKYDVYDASGRPTKSRYRVDCPECADKHDQPCQFQASDMHRFDSGLNTYWGKCQSARDRIQGKIYLSANCVDAEKHNSY